MSRLLLIKGTRSGEYATADDFQRLFASEMTNLFHLALMLIADPENAECCVIRAIRDCMSVDSVSKEWMRIWARRAVVRNAIRIVAGLRTNPLIGNSDGEFLPSNFESQCSIACTMDESAGILTLDSFDRLVYVICVVEHYSVRDCALLMGASHQDVLNARNRALDQIAAFEEDAHCESASSFSDLRPVTGTKPGGLDDSCGTLLD